MSRFRDVLPFSYIQSRLVLAALIVATSSAFGPSVAAGAACPSTDLSDTGNCGPWFTTPSWTDAAGWDDPSQYSTIQLADVNGDGSDELIGRGDAGLEVWRFDTEHGQWRPQVDAKGIPQSIRDFATPPPWQASNRQSPDRPQYYSTIQAADVDGGPGEEIIARFWDGMRVYRYDPPAGGTAIDGGTWTNTGAGYAFSDNMGYGNDASLYSSIHIARFKQGDPPLLYGRGRGVNAPMVLWKLEPDVHDNWERVPNGPGLVTFSDPACSKPSCYLTLQASDLAPAGRDDPTDAAEMLGRSDLGVSLYDEVQGYWNWLNEDYDATVDGFPPFGDHAGSADVFYPDCPFSAGGASGDGSADCVGSSPSYYETLTTADIDGVEGDELLARASDGLRVKKWVPGPSGGKWDRLPTLNALAGAASSVADGMWGSIRTGDINKDGKQEVLALDGTALQAWTYNPTERSWNRLRPTTPLALASDPWLTHPEYYSTIQTGDVDGDGRDDVVARGSFGIRTWFYDRRGTGGWERYQADGYPAFSTASENRAFTALTALAASRKVIDSDATSVRDAWAGENAPDPSDLTRLLTDLPAVADCTGLIAGDPPSYQACTPPSGSGIEAGAWTTVVNTMLSEISDAYQVVRFFGDLDGMRQHLFVAEGSELPALGADLGLQQASGSTADFDPAQGWSVTFGILASIAGVAPEVGTEASAALWVVSELVSLMPAASATAMSDPFPATYAGLQTKFTQMVTEIDKALAVQSQTVRQDASLLSLVADLRSSGTWGLDKLDPIGLESAANQGFSTWIYKTLVPTLYDRYHIKNCSTTSNSNWTTTCSGPAAGTGVIGGGSSFISLAQVYDENDDPAYNQALNANGVPCNLTTSELSFPGITPNSPPTEVTEYLTGCTFTPPPADLLQRIWGPMSSTCRYTPGQSVTQWTWGCSVGADVYSTLGENTWKFNSYIGDPDPMGPQNTFPDTGQAAVSADAAVRVRRRPLITIGRPRLGRRRAARGHALLRAEVNIPRRMPLSGASVRMPRLLFERRGHGELTRPRGSKGPRTIKLRLRRTASGRFTAATPSRGRRVRVALRRARRGRTALSVAIRAKGFRVPRACHALPAGTALKTPPLYLHTRLVVSDGRRRHPVVLTHRVRCRRDARGNVDRLVRVRQRVHPRRGGLAVSLRGPRRVEPGAKAIYVARVSNRRRGRDRLRSSVWDVRVAAHRGTKRIRELRRGRSRTFVFTRRVPRHARRTCVPVAASAPGTRTAVDRVCSRVRAAG